MSETPEKLKSPCERMFEQLLAGQAAQDARLKNMELFLGQIGALVQVAQSWTGRGATIVTQFEEMSTAVAETRKLATAAWKEARAVRKAAKIGDNAVREA